LVRIMLDEKSSSAVNASAIPRAGPLIERPHRGARRRP
jgi:hypothetical protein